MRWYTFWDDQGQFHRLPSVTTILNLTQPPQASTRKRQSSRQRGDRLPPGYSHRETPYQVPTYPSQRRSRNWPATHPAFPCKHIIAAVLAIADQGSVQQWSQEAEGDMGEGARPRATG